MCVCVHLSKYNICVCHDKIFRYTELRVNSIMQIFLYLAVISRNTLAHFYKFSIDFSLNLVSYLKN